MFIGLASKLCNWEYQFQSYDNLQITYMVNSNIFYSILAEISFQSNNVPSNGKKVNSSSFHLSFPAALMNTRSILVKYVLGMDLDKVMFDT